MLRRLRALCFAAAFAVLPMASHAQSSTRAPAESARSFAGRALHLPAPAQDDNTHVVETKWNGRTVLFVDYPEENDRMVVALEQQPDGSYRKLDITDGEEEGGQASVAAIGFAKAEKSVDQQLIVMLTWPVQHAISEGTLYEIRIFEDAKPGQTALTLLKPISDKLSANGCDCDQEGKVNHFRFKTIAAVKAELTRLGF